MKILDSILLISVMAWLAGCELIIGTYSESGFKYSYNGKTYIIISGTSVSEDGYDDEDFNINSYADVFEQLPDGSWVVAGRTRLANVIIKNGESVSRVSDLSQFKNLPYSDSYYENTRSHNKHINSGGNGNDGGSSSS